MTQYQTRDLLRAADLLLIVPPFAWQDRPSLGLHLLQGVARRAGLEAQVFYANLTFAAYFDEGTHSTLSRIQHGLFLGERLFARAAFDTPPLGRDNGAGLVPKLEVLRKAHERRGLPFALDLATLLRFEATVDGWLDSIVCDVARADHLVVGATSSFEQNAVALAILRRIKQVRPEVITILGGANCEGEMAEGICSLAPDLDHVFSGESEGTFAKFLEAVVSGAQVSRIVHGTPTMDLDSLPTPDYADYYAQLRALMPNSLLVTRGCTCLTYETSRGCWWGAKNHCTFCGLNGMGMAHREKSADRVIEELRVLLASHPVTDARGITMGANDTMQGNRDRPSQLVTLTDNIMPHSYFRTLVPRLAEELPGLTLMYEQKANLSLLQVLALVKAGITEIQPGIESLSTGLLKLMRKGTTAAQNVALLRYGKVAGMYIYWNLLFAFPNDLPAHYEEMDELIPLLVHVQPPVAACPVIFDRFSPYFDHPEQHGISNLRPMGFYGEVLPQAAPLAKIAYHFEGDYQTAIGDRPELGTKLAESIAAWRARHYTVPAPVLTVEALGDGQYRFLDTRRPADVCDEVINELQAASVLVPGTVRTSQYARFEWALERRATVIRDGKFVPLATASADLLIGFEQRYRNATDPLVKLAV